jgi:pimeloyl-ACP methyl ester carboxylesterase
LLAVGRPGCGGSDPMPAGAWATVASAAEDLGHVLAERGETQVGLVGWGEGGWSALALAAHVPGLVHRLVLIGTPAPDESLPYLPASTRDLIARLAGGA